jgi:uncharacterized protein YkwD
MIRKWKILALALLALGIQTVRANALEVRIRNDFDKSLHVAVVYYEPNHKKWRTTGWWAVQPRGSRNVSFNTSGRDIYLYAQLSDRSIIWWQRGDIHRYVIDEAFSYYEGQNCPQGSIRMNRGFRKFTAQNSVVNFRPRADNQPQQQPQPQPQPKPQPKPQQQAGRDLRAYGEQLRAEFYRLVNNHRRANGRRELAVNTSLQGYADRRASELRVSFGHTRPDGSAAGSGWHNSTNMMNTRFAENAASTAWSLDQNPAKAAEHFFTKWRNSKGHNDHMLYNFKREITMALGLDLRIEDNRITSPAIWATGY